MTGHAVRGTAHHRNTLGLEQVIREIAVRLQRLAFRRALAEGTVARGKNVKRAFRHGAMHARRFVQCLNDEIAPALKQIGTLAHEILRAFERGYAGQSIWDWWRLPDYKGPRYTDYARANASIGINGTVLNNVNAKADSLTAPYIAKAAALADVFRPYGIKVYLSVKWTAPMELDGLKTADPLDPAVFRCQADHFLVLILRPGENG